MADIAASDVTVTVEEVNRYVPARKRRNRVSVAFGDGALTYPSLGVPMPAASAFALVRQLDDLLIIDPANGNGFVYKWDRANKKIRIYEEQDTSGELIELVGGVATPALATLGCEAIGW